MDFSIKYASQMMLSTIMCSLFLYCLINFTHQFNYSELTTSNIFITPDFSLSTIKLEADNIALKVNQDFELANYVKAYDEIDGDITNKVIIYHDININQKGYYKARFVVRNSQSQWIDKVVDVRVDE